MLESDPRPITSPDDEVLAWLLHGDVSIQYQARRDLLDDDRPDLRRRIAKEGWGARYLACRNANGTWGQHFYQPKWKSSHYTLLDLRNLCVTPDQLLIRQSIDQIAAMPRGSDGSLYPIGTRRRGDVCLNGMFLNYASYFGQPETSLQSIIDFILDQRMADGGFNCQKNSVGARHSSLHSTLSVAEGIQEYIANGYGYRLDELRQAAGNAREFMLVHRLYRSDRTGEIIRKDFLRPVFPPRWKYNILRALDHFRAANAPGDDRMSDALEVILSQRRPDGRWRAVAGHPGQVHFHLEKPRSPSHIVTLTALRVLKSFGSSGQ